uniref:beta-N-acetylhexosaminidase n=1 Tax=Serinus canaria TaxID=9135 RepID=A0A8C9U896_SERCA
MTGSLPTMRLVHLDLKGAAPRVSYLEQVFPLLSQLGANGVLIEYEDMFPFKGELEILRSPYAYSEEDIERIQQLAEQHKLEVVPLVQTFGHVEFILKHEKYQHLREVERFPNSFNPHVPDTLALLKSILAQVIEKHRRSTWIHIGADEVGRGCAGTPALSPGTGGAPRAYWGLRVLMWDDMLRKISVGALRESGIAKHVSPVVWFYAPDFEAEQIGKFLTKYVESGFEAVWFASAFKGTTGPAQAWTPLSYHLKNHLSWLKVMQAVPRLAPLRLQGVVLTGWQRYDHYSVLCELLPVSIPSLAICLQTLVNGEPPAPAAWPGSPPAPTACQTPSCWAGPWGGGRQRRKSFSSLRVSPMVRCPWLFCPFPCPPRGLHRRGKEEGPGCAGLGERAAGAEHLVCGTWLGQLHHKGCTGGRQGLGHPDLPGWIHPAQRTPGAEPSPSPPFPQRGQGSVPWCGDLPHGGAGQWPPEGEHP